ncbi:hypothetical protein PVAND_017620, partial [Polypedilum vanderplanki]
MGQNPNRTEEEEDVTKNG